MIHWIHSGAKTATRTFDFGRTHVVRPKGRHLATVVWLHGLGDNGARYWMLPSFCYGLLFLTVLCKWLNDFIFWAVDKTKLWCCHEYILSCGQNLALVLINHGEFSIDCQIGSEVGYDHKYVLWAWIFMGQWQFDNVSFSLISILYEMDWDTMLLPVDHFLCYMKLGHAYHQSKLLSNPYCHCLFWILASNWWASLLGAYLCSQLY